MNTLGPFTLYTPQTQNSTLTLTTYTYPLTRTMLLCSNTVFNKTLRSAIAVLPVGAQVGSPSHDRMLLAGARGSDTKGGKGGKGGKGEGKEDGDGGGDGDYDGGGDGGSEDENGGGGGEAGTGDKGVKGVKEGVTTELFSAVNGPVTRRRMTLVRHIRRKSFFEDHKVPTKTLTTEADTTLILRYVDRVKYLNTLIPYYS